MIFSDLLLKHRADYVEKSLGIERNFVDIGERLKFSENNNICIVTCSGNLYTLGRVLDVNKEITNVLGYSNIELTGENVSKIMPRVIGDIHDNIMRNFFETSESGIIGRDRTVLAMHKNGYLVPCILMTKIYPNLDEGIRVVGFLKKIVENNKLKGAEDNGYSYSKVQFLYNINKFKMQRLIIFYTVEKPT